MNNQNYAKMCVVEILREFGFHGEKYDLCLNYAMTQVENEFRTSQGDIIDERRVVFRTVDPLIPYVNYDNPVLAKQLIDFYLREGSIPKEQIEVIRLRCSTFRDLQGKLMNIDISYGIWEILTESKKVPDGKKGNFLVDIDSDGSWGNAVRLIEG